MEATLRFRDDLRTSWHEVGARVSLAVVATYVTTGCIFGLSLRATGLDQEALSIGAIAVVYTIVRLLTIVNFTPGGRRGDRGALHLGAARGDRRGLRVRDRGRASSSSAA